MVKTSITSTRNGSRALDYAINDNNDPHDTHDPLITHRVLLSGGVNCTVRGAKKQMNSIWHKANARQNRRVQAYRVIQSFDLSELDPHNQDDIEKANQIGIETAKQLFPNRQVVVATQADGIGHKLHNHIVVNSLDYQDLKALRGKSRYQPHVAMISDKVAEEMGVNLALEKVTDDNHRLRAKKRHPIGATKMQKRIDKNNASSKPDQKLPKMTFNKCIQEHLDRALKDPEIVDFESAKKIMREKYYIDLRVRKNGVSYKMIADPADKSNPDQYKGTKRGKSMGSDYMKEAYSAIFNANLKRKKAESKRRQDPTKTAVRNAIFGALGVSEDTPSTASTQSKTVRIQTRSSNKPRTKSSASVAYDDPLEPLNRTIKRTESQVSDLNVNSTANDSATAQQKEQQQQIKQRNINTINRIRQQRESERDQLLFKKRDKSATFKKYNHDLKFTDEVRIMIVKMLALFRSRLVRGLTEQKRHVKNDHHNDLER